MLKTRILHQPRRAQYDPVGCFQSWADYRLLPDARLVIAHVEHQRMRGLSQRLFVVESLARPSQGLQRATADSGYGSEENDRFMDEAGMDAYVKYNRFHIEQRPRYKTNAFHHDNFHYNVAEDYCVCPMGQHMTRIGTKHSKTASAYRSENARFRARNCNGCPVRCLRYKAKGDRRIIEVNHRLNEYKRRARELPTSEDGLKHQGRRCIEPEVVFGQMKFNMAYRHFRHFGKDKVTTDFAFSPLHST